LGNTPLRPRSQRCLDTGCWRQDGHIVYACFELKKNTSLALQA